MLGAMNFFENVRIGILGAGRVGQTLALAFGAADLRVRAVHSRSAASRQALLALLPGTPVAASAQALVDGCDWVFLTVSDDAIEPVCTGLAWRAGQRVLHCSGATPLAALNTAAAQGALVGGFHPLQMFVNPRLAFEGLAGCTVGIAGDAPVRAELEVLAQRLGCRARPVSEALRGLYHASAYYVGPFLIALLAEASAIWRELGADEEQALAALLPLLRGTLDAVGDGGLARGMGGCVARGDLGTVWRHLRALDGWDADAGRLYRQLALRTVPLGLARGSLAPARAAEIEQILLSPSAPP